MVEYHKDDEAVRGVTGNHALVRLAHPGNTSKNRDGWLFYNSLSSSWVSIGYTTWSMKEWKSKFGRQPDEGRCWEFFGEIIPLYDKGDRP